MPERASPQNGGLRSNPAQPSDVEYATWTVGDELQRVLWTVGESVPYDYEWGR